MGEKLLWPDDVPVQFSDNLSGLLGGFIPYSITSTALNIEPGLVDKFRTSITNYIVRTYDGTNSVTIGSADLSTIKALVRPRFQARLDAALTWMGRRLDESLSVQLNLGQPEDKDTFALRRASSCSNLEQLRDLLKFGQDQGLVALTLYMGGEIRVGLTTKALIHLENQREVGIASRYAFVAMWFSPETQDAYLRGIEPAISGSGYEAVRIDQKEHSNKIDDEIISEIRKARFVIADFSCGDDGVRGGVYFEAGFALALQ